MGRQTLGPTGCRGRNLFECFCLSLCVSVLDRYPEVNELSPSCFGITGRFHGSIDGIRHFFLKKCRQDSWVKSFEQDTKDWHFFKPFDTFVSSLKFSAHIEGIFSFEIWLTDKKNQEKKHLRHRRDRAILLFRTWVSLRDHHSLFLLLLELNHTCLRLPLLMKMCSAEPS